MTSVPLGRLREIAARYGAASTAPWRWGNDGLEHSGQMQHLVLALPHPYLTQSRAADLELIEHAPDDISYLLGWVAQLEHDLSVAERNLSEIQDVVTTPQPLRQFEQQVDVQPVLDRAAKLEAALEVVAAREVLNSAARDQVVPLVTLAYDAWGVIADAENFKHILVDGQPVPIGSQEWRDAAHRWRDRFHQLTTASGPAPVLTSEQPTNHERYDGLVSEFNRATDEIERLRGIVRSMETDHAQQQARWQPQLDELTSERDAASRQLAACRDAQTELERQLRKVDDPRDFL